MKRLSVAYMTNGSVEYRRRAKDAELKVDQANTSEVKESWRKVAKGWSDLADQADRMDK